MAIDVRQPADLHDLTQIHDGKTVTDILGRRQIMGDEQVGQIELILQTHHQLQQEGTHRNIGHGDRLIGDHQTGMGYQRPGDNDPLPLPATDLVRILVVKQLGRS